MKKIGILISIVLSLNHVFAQHDNDSIIKRNFNSYTIDLIQNPDSTYYKDTLTDNFHNFLPQQKVSFNNLGFTDPGNPFIPAVFSSMPKNNDFWFFNNYFPYIQTHDQIVYFDTKHALTLFKFTGGQKGVELLKFIHSQNIGSSLNFTLNYDITSNSEGFYMNNKNKIHSISLAGAYTKHKYQAHVNFIFNRINNEENGGIKSEENFEDPAYRPEAVDVNLKGSKNKMSQLGIQYNQEYRFGSYDIDTILLKDDTIINKILKSKFSFIHDIKFDRFFRVYTDNSNDFYVNNFFDPATTYDSTVYHLTENMIYLNLLLTGNGIISKFQVLAGIKSDFNYYQNINKVKYFNPEAFDTIRYADFYSSHYLSGIIKFNTSKSNFNGKLNYGILGRNIFDIEINATYNQTITKSLNFDAYFNFERKTPDIFYSFYKSNHFEWHNPDLSKINKTNGGISLNLNKLNLSLGTNINLLHNYFIFNTTSIPEQIKDANLIVDVFIKNLLKIRDFYWFNQLTYQYISDRENVPLPQFVVYSDLYFKKDLFKKALTLQLGVDLKFHTNIYGYAYMPAIGAFYLQNNKEFGNYPNIGVYGSLKVKRLKGFLKFSNVSSLFMPQNYYSLYKIPDNPMSFNFGISWDFYD